MAIENINDYAGMWANGVNIGQLWDKIKEKFVSGAHVQSDATTYPASWKQQARANIGLTIGANKMWYGSAANTIGEVTTSTFGRGLLNTSSGTEITGLFAETAEKDKNGIEISENYAHSLAISNGYLRLKNNRYVSGSASAQDLSALQLNVKLGLLQLDNTGSAGKIPLVHIPDSIMGQLTYGGTITAYTQSTDSLTVSITTGAKAILEQKTGRTIGNKTVKLVATATDPSDTSSIAYFNYTDCTGIYFIWTADALESHTGEPDYRVWPSGGPRYQAGDWLISNDTKWDKVDNTDAVTGVKGSNESAFRLGNVSIDALDVRALATYLTNTTQNVEDKVQFKKDIWSLGGVAAYGISDLSAGGGGGGGLSGTIIRNWSNYQGAETEVLGANLGMRGFRMSGYSFQVNKPAVNTDNWQTEFTLGTENIPDLPLTQITGTDDLRAIEALTATSGFLKKTAANTWALQTLYAPTSGGAAGYVLIGKGTTTAPDWTSDIFVDATNHRVGIGTTTPATKLHIRGTSGEILRLSMEANYTAGAGPKIVFKNDTAEDLASISGVFDRASNGNYGNLIFGTRTSDALGVQPKMTILYNGAVGIGTTTPDAKLHVDGNIKGVQLISTQAQGTAPLVVTSTTKVSNLNADLLDGYEASGLFESLTNDNDQLKIQIGNTTKSLTLDYAKKTSRMRTEINADQEFVYRQSPQTIDADSLVINKFKGRTVAWNQLIDDTNSALVGATGVTFTKTGHVIKANGTASTVCVYGFYSAKTNLISGHKYLFVGFGSATGSNSTFEYMVVEHVSSSPVKNIYSDGVFEYSGTTKYNCEGQIVIRSGYTANNLTIVPQLIDLTLLFNGSIPSGFSVSDYHTMYPEAYYPYTAGELRNNDAKAFESVGENLFNNSYDNYGLASDGSINTSDAAHNHSDWIRVFPSTAYFLGLTFANATGPSALATGVYQYDANKNFISKATLTATSYGRKFTSASNCYYIRFDLSYTGVEVCTLCYDKEKYYNVYIPYKKTITELGLNEIKVKSHNIWDEEWEVGALDTGGIINTSETSRRTTSFIPILGGQTYYFKAPSNAGSGRTAYYDANKNCIYYSQTGSDFPLVNSTFTPPTNAAFMRLSFGYAYGTTYNNDICINESSSFNGQYEPHGILTINGLKQAGSVYDEIVRNKLVKRLGEIDMGNLNWQESGTHTEYYCNPSESVLPIKMTTNPACLCSKYVYLYSTTSTDKSILFTISGASTREFRVRDSYYFNGGSTIAVPASTFKSDVTGQKIIYELATPIEYELASPIPDTMPAGTTERIISDRLPVTPFACDMTYGANPKDILASAVPFSRLQGVRLERGAFTMSTQNDSNWYLVTLGDKKLYLRFTVNTGAFKLEMASDDTENPEYSKSFEFATLSTSEIDAICV